jgi:hypothetical protein
MVLLLMLELRRLEAERETQAADLAHSTEIIVAGG